MADQATIDQLVEYYADLLIIQYNIQPKARATILLIARELLANGVIFDVLNGYNIDTAVGKQLDIIGKYVGVDRFYQSQDIDFVAFGFSDAFSYEPPDVTGYARPADFLLKDGTYLSASDVIGTGYSLSDNDFRTLIRLKILLNNSNFSDKEIDDTLFSIFGDSLYAVDNYNMSMEYFTDSTLSLIVRVALAKELLPHPMAVRINNVIETNTYFGFINAAQQEGEGITGFAAASDFLTKNGEFLGVDNFIA